MYLFSHTTWSPPQPHQNSPPHHSPSLSTNKPSQKKKMTTTNESPKKQTLPGIGQAFQPIDRPPEIALEPFLHRDQYPAKRRDHYLKRTAFRAPTIERDRISASDRRTWMGRRRRSIKVCGTAGKERNCGKNYPSY